MEKTCEFCGAPRPVVYCQADMAFLCLSCDAKVHSANALSGRHSRSLVCDWCRMNPASVRCLDHLLLLCRGCETRVHHDQTGLVGPQHRNQVMGSFTGCPSANHFAALWGINTAGELGGQGLDRRRGGARFGSGSHVSSDDLSTGEFKHPGSVAAAAKGGVSSQRHKQAPSHEQEQKNHLIMQQILELEKLQLTEGNNGPSSLLHRHHGESVKSFSSTYNTSGNSDESLGRQSKELEYPLVNDLESFNNQSQDLKDGRLPSPISQLDQLSCSSAVGEPFWQYKGPVDSSQFWSQNMQDLGMCEDLGSLDDLNIPDVDPTFRNFDDLFTNDVDLSQALLEDDDMIFSNIHKGTSVENRHSKDTTEDVSAGSSISITKHINSKHKEKAYDNHSVGYSQHMMRSASFSRSRLSAESSGSECLDSGHSGSFFMQEASNSNAQVQEDGVYNERKKARLVHGKQSQLAPRKAKGDMHKRIKGRVVSMEGYESDSMNATKSY